MGQRLTCARCHNHPLEKWTQKQYYQFANLFSRVGLKNGDEPGDIVVFAKASGDINHPRLLKPLPPTPLDGTPMSLDSTDDRRVHFADWLTSPKNPFFARAIVNRVWANFMGRGLVDPVDDVRATNPASNEELFAALSKDFVENGYDVKRLIRTIMNSGVVPAFLRCQRHQSEATTNITRKYIVKRLPAEVLLDAMSQVTGVPAQVRRLSGGHARAAIARYAGAVGIPDVVRPAEADPLRCRRAIERAQHCAGAARDQRRHAEQEAERRRTAIAALALKLGLSRRADSGSSVSVRLQPVSDRGGEAAACWQRCSKARADHRIAGGAARSAPRRRWKT